MNKLVATLAATTVLFAGTTLYMWQKLGEREAADAAVQTAAATTPGPGTPSVTASATPASMRPAGMPAAGANTATTPGSEAAAGPASASGDASRQVMLPFAKDFLRQYEDPALRTSLVKAARTGMASQYARLRERLKLDANTFNQLVDVLSEEQVEMQAGFYRCFVNPSCDTSKLGPPPDHSDEYLALLGADKYADFTAYRTSMPEWQSVVQLRGRLSESNYLTDSNAERLISALSAARERYTTETNQAGAKLRGWGTGAGMVWYSADGGAEEQLASAAQFSERMRQSAATVLSADQLRAYVQLQEELLAALATYLHSQFGKPG